MKTMLTLLAGILFFSSFVVAQDDPKSNVELPDFVITGKDQINFPPAKKIKPDVISALSEEFIYPPYKAEEFSSGEISTPESIVSFKKDSAKVYHGLFSMHFGNLSVPEFFGSYTLGLGSFKLIPSLRMKNIRDFEPNSGENTYNFNLNSVYTTDIESGFFSSMIIEAGAAFHSDNRKLYKDALAYRVRDLNLFSLNTGVRKSFSGNGGMYFSGEVSSAAIKEFSSELSSTELSLGGFMKFSKFMLSADAEILSISLDNLDKVYYRITPGLSYSNPGAFSLNVAGGPVKAGENSGISLDGSLGLNLSSALGISISYESGWKPTKLMPLLIEVPYLIPDSSSQLFENRKHHLRFETKYSFKHYFEGLVFIKTGKTENMNYFLKDTSTGAFRTSSANASIMSMGIDLKFHEGPMGYLYAHAELNSVTDDNSKTLPFVPSLKGNLVYGKQLNKSWGITTGADFLSAPYTNLPNLNKTESYLDLNFTLEYKLGFLTEGSSVTLKANNLLDAGNNYWDGYPGRPADYRIGFEMKF